MATIESLANHLETSLIGGIKTIDRRLWRVLQVSDADFPDEMIRVIDFTFYYTFT